MLGVKIEKSKAEKVKSILMDKEVLDRRYVLSKDEKHLFFPILKIDDELDPILVEQGAEICDMEFEKHEEENDYKSILNGRMPQKKFDMLPSSFDMMGDIIILGFLEGLEEYERMIGDALLKTNKNIHTVLKKTGIHEGEFRTQKLKYICGKDTKETIYKENNIRLKLNVEEVYFSSRLATERKRIFEQVKKGENVLVMFSGCGPYPLSIRKNTAAGSIVAVEKNPVAHRYALMNQELNKADDIRFICGDVREIVPELDEKFDRILMPLPKDADTFLDIALMAARKGTVVHLYDFEHESEIDKGTEKVKRMVKCPYKIINVVKCGQYSPGKYRICIDFQLV